MLKTVLLLLLHLGAFTVLANQPIIETHHLILSKGEVLSITSPGYPDIPPSGSKINWEIATDEDNNVLLTCEDIRISPSENCQYGYFRIFDGRNSAQYCDSKSELSVQSIENTMRLELYLNRAPGVFKCKIEAIQKQHQQVQNEQQSDGENNLMLVSGQEVSFKTPDYPNSPPYNTTVMWRISTDADGRLLLNCEDFRTIPSPDCVESYLMIFDGTQEQKYCESTAYLSVPSTGNRMDVKFHISRTVGVLSCKIKATGAEQLLNANIDPVTKRTDFFIEQNEEIAIISPDYHSGPGEHVTWEITSEYGTQVLLQCDDFRILESHDCVDGYLMIFDGINEEKHCTSDPELRVRSSGNVMRLEFDVGVPLFNCKAKAVEAQIGQTMNAGDQENVIKLEPRKEVFDEIYFKQLEPFTNLIWNFETSSPYRISFFCATIKVSPCNSKQRQLFVSDAVNETATCGSGYDRTVAISTGNKLRIELKTGGTVNQYTLDCLVQAISGNSPFEFKNIESEEIDSSEHGRTPGRRNTTCNCGRTAKKYGRIVNGELAADGEFPWMVALRFLKINYYSYLCGAAIISEYHVITAAHCTDSQIANNILVYIGTINNTHAENGQIIRVKQNILRQNYNRTAFVSNDLAILVLEERIQFTKRIGPICLTREYLNLDDQYVKAMGWGNIESRKNTWKYPKELLKTRLRIVNFKVCSFLYYREFVTQDPHRLCMWGVNTTICMGDSGGPVVWLDPETNRYTLVGVVSLQQDCSLRNPSVNAFVPYHYDWIQEIITATMPTSRTCDKI